MDSMSHDPAAGDIGSQLVEIAIRGLDAGIAAALSVTGLLPAGAEEVSAQAAAAFATEAASMLAANTAAQEELMRTGMALTDIARMYNQADDDAAGALAFNAASIPGSSLDSSSAASMGAALVSAEALPGAAPAMTPTPLTTGGIGTYAAPVTQTAANVGTSTGSGAAPLNPMSQSGAASGNSKTGLAPVTARDQNDDEEPHADDEHRIEERLL